MLPDSGIVGEDLLAWYWFDYFDCYEVCAPCPCVNGYFHVVDLHSHVDYSDEWLVGHRSRHLLGLLEVESFYSLLMIITMVAQY